MRYIMAKFEAGKFCIIKDNILCKIVTVVSRPELSSLSVNDNEEMCMVYDGMVYHAIPSTVLTPYGGNVYQLTGIRNDNLITRIYLGIGNMDDILKELSSPYSTFLNVLNGIVANTIEDRTDKALTLIYLDRDGKVVSKCRIEQIN